MKRIYYRFSAVEDPAPEDFITKSLPYSEANEEIAGEEAWRGEYSILDDGQPDPGTASADDVLNVLLGVNV